MCFWLRAEMATPDTIFLPRREPFKLHYRNFAAAVHGHTRAFRHTAVLLKQRMVLLAGGFDVNSNNLAPRGTVTSRYPDPAWG